MSETNKDGLIPGQQVDFETMQRVNRERTQRLAEQAQPEAPKRGRPAKPTEAD